jgi:hypothetical protein
MIVYRLQGEGVGDEGAQEIAVAIQRLSRIKSFV